MLPRLQRVVAAEIRRFAHLCHGVAVRAAAFADDERDEAGQVGFEGVRGALEHRGALRRRAPRPSFERRAGAIECRIELSRRSERHLADRVCQVSRLARCMSPRGGCGHAIRLGDCSQPAEFVAAVEVEAAGILAVGIERARQRDALVRAVRLGEQRERIGDQALERHRRIGDLVHEGGVGAVLQHPAHQVREQIVEAAHRRIDPAGCRRFGRERRIERFAHAEQALEFEFLPAGKLEHRRDGAAIVRRKCRVNGAGEFEQPLRARRVAEIGRRLARVDRIVGHAQHLRPF